MFALTLLLLIPLAQDPEPPAPEVPEVPATEAPRPQEPEANPWKAKKVKTPEQIRTDEQSAKLGDVERVLAQAWFNLRPWEARELGMGFANGHIGGFSASERRGWKQTLEASADALLQIDAFALSLERRMVYERLRGWVHGQTVLAVNSVGPSRDPYYYVDAVLRSLRSVAEVGAPDDPYRFEALLRVIDGIPRVWMEADAELVGPNEFWIGQAVEHAAGLSSYLREEIPRRFAEDLRVEARRARYTETTESSLASIQTFVESLSRELDRPRNELLRFGKPAWESALRGLSGTEMSVLELKLALLRDLSDLDHEIQSRLGALAAANGEPEAPTDDTVLDVERVLAEGLSFAKEAGLAVHVTPADAPVPQPRILPTPSRTSPLATLLLPSIDGGTLLFWEPTPAWFDGERASRRTYTTEAGLQALALRYGGSGEAGILKDVVRRKATLSATVSNPITTAGFGLYAPNAIAEIYWHDNPLKDRPEVILELVRQRVLEAARLYAALRLHAEDVPLERLIEDFRNQTGVDTKIARREVFGAMRNPFSGLAYLGMLEIELLESELLAKSESPIQAKTRTFVLVRGNPGARPGDIRRWNDYEVW